MPNKNIVIAIDGHSSCGKSTVAKELARALSIAYIDTGAMYRSVTLYGLQNQLIDNDLIKTQQLIAALDDIRITFNFNPQNGRNETFLNGQNVEQQIRSLVVSQFVSRVSAIPQVRRKLVDWQRNMAAEQSVVMDGRDIGTVVFPHADLKIFMTASDEIRARRRFDELTAKGQKVDFQDILDNVRERDTADTTRAESPLRQADDAILLDNSDLTPDEQFNRIMQLLRERNLINR